MIDVVVRWKCDICGAEHVECQGNILSDDNEWSQHLHFGASLYLQHLPEGWHYINRQIVCPLHEVVLKPIDTAGQFDFAKKIYDGHYGTVPSPLPDSMIPDGLQRK
jgi:hypothetical protein